MREVIGKIRLIQMHRQKCAGELLENSEACFPRRPVEPYGQANFSNGGIFVKPIFVTSSARVEKTKGTNIKKLIRSPPTANPGQRNAGGF